MTRTARPGGRAGEPGVEQLAGGLAALLAHASFGLGLVDRDLRFVVINEALAEINGIAVAETIGKTVAEVVPEIAAIVVPLYERALGGEVVAEVEITGETARAPGELRDWVASYFPVTGVDGEVTGVVLAVEEVTDQRRAERAEAAAREAERVARSTFDAFVRAAPFGMAVTDREHRYQLINDWLARIGGFPADEHLGRSPRELFPSWWDDELQSWYARVLETGVAATREVVAPSVQDPTADAIYQSTSFPIVAGGEAVGIGTVVLDVTDARAAESALQRYASRLEALRELDGAVLAAQTAPEVANIALERLRALVPFVRATVVFVDVERGEAETLAVLGVGPHPPVRYPIPRTLPLDRLARGEVVVIDDILAMAPSDDERIVAIVRAVVDAGVRATALFPLLVEGELLGALSIGAPEAAFLTTERLEIGRDTAGRIALAIRQRRLDAARQEALRQLEILRELSTALLSARTPEEVGAVSIERANALVPCRRVSLSRIVDDGRSGVLLASVAAGVRVIDPGTRYDLQAGPAIDALRGGDVQVMAVDASPLPESYRQGLHAEGATWLIVAPLVVEGAWVGALTFGFASPDEIRPDQVEMAGQIASPIALALRDVTLLAALEESERRFRTLADSASVMIWVGDEHGRDVFNNRGWLEFRGTTAATELQHPWPAGVHPDDVERVVEEYAEAVRGRVPCTLEYRMLNAAGEYRTLVDTSVPLRRGDGSFAGFVGTAIDITQMLRLEAELQQAQKLEAVGTLASGVAHDFNNLVGVIAGYAALIEGDADVSDAVRDHAQQILRAGEDAAEITRRLLAFGREDGGEQERPVELRGLLDGIRPLLTRLLPAETEVVMDTGGTDVVVSGSSTRIGQVLVNLAVNATDAMPDGGRLAITLEAGPEIATITVTDTGTGIAPELLPQVFEPFFTTKELGKGTGLGLSTVRRIVEELEGTVSVTSTVGEGSSFVIELPRLREPGDAAAGTTAATGPSAGAGTCVLVADDNELVRNLVSTILTRAGYVVETASDGAHALAAVDRGLLPALVVSDVSMPVSGGLDLIAALAERGHDVPVLLMSGYAAEDAGEIEGRPFIHKPFTPAELLEAVSALLQRGRG